MDGFINQQQIDYVFYHISFLMELTPEIKNRFQFYTIENNFDQQKIIFRLSDKPFIETEIITIDEIPLLFPVSNNLTFFETKNQNVIFNHDLLKSAFYLLSGYQESQAKQLDKYERFPYEASIQKRLHFIQKPIVNYYFEIIVNGIETYCKINKIDFRRKKIFNNFGFWLSHDVDCVDNFTWRSVGFRIKQLLGFAPLTASRKAIAKLLFRTIYENLKFNKKANLFWNFNFLVELEKSLGIKSTFFFLPRQSKFDGKYSVTETRIKELIKYLENENVEIALHGSFSSMQNFDKLKTGLNQLQSITNQKITGVRQHYLRCRIPETFISQQKLGLKFDSSLTFTAHEGFRNSYCLPFKLFDFEKNAMINLWEIPLTVMDVSWLHHRKLSFEEMEQSLNKILAEVKKFNGIFTLLWHNDQLDEFQFCGITEFYSNLLRKIANQNPEFFSGKEIIDKLENV